MTREYVFNVWATPGGPWSPWVKPVLFAFVDRAVDLTRQLFAPAEGLGLPRADSSTALVLDLPGALGVALGVHAARQGFRPIPLYNALPWSQPAALTVCNVRPILEAILLATPILDGLNLPHNAPPAFLLDSTRRFGTERAPSPGMFDNRSISLVTDFPSANRMLANGIRHVVLVQQTALEPQDDLSHTLFGWQRAGIMIESAPLEPATARAQIQVRRPSLYRSLFQRVLALAGMRRSPLGGFGGILPIPSESGGIG